MQDSRMEIIRTVEWMKQIAQEARLRGSVSGLVPTMGALHEGHFSLIRQARRECSPVTVSIFVNPTQFGPAEDFQKYPRPFEADVAALGSLGADYLFAPTPEEMYPRGFGTSVNVEDLGDRLEGRSRPGHFRGVATVVLKLLEIVQPQLSFFGRKDAQQLRILRQMVSDLNLDAKIVACPIARAPDGLALSSRNAYLDAQERKAAAALYRALDGARQKVDAGERDAAALLASLRSVLAAESHVKVDYAEIVDADSFEPVATIRRDAFILLAAFVGRTRLIDNAWIEAEGDVLRVTI
ncbi:MAG TPA: pantoate--beta-alanine ligase [Candidatus Acidoferrales bacterium]